MFLLYFMHACASQMFLLFQRLQDLTGIRFKSDVQERIYGVSVYLSHMLEDSLLKQHTRTRMRLHSYTSTYAHTRKHTNHPSPFKRSQWAKKLRRYDNHTYILTRTHKLTITWWVNKTSFNRVQQRYPFCVFLMRKILPTVPLLSDGLFMLTLVSITATATRDTSNGHADRRGLGWDLCHRQVHTQNFIRGMNSIRFAILSIELNQSYKKRS